MKKMDRFLTRLRQDKSEVLSQDLKEMEIKIELIKVSCKDAVKNIKACSRFPTKEPQGEARMKKLPEMALATQMKKSGYELMENEKDSQLGMILDRAGDIEGTIGHLINNFETAVDEEIVNSLSKFCKEDFQNLVKSKDVLQKTVNAKNAAETKASRHSVHLANGKIDTSKDEVEELGQKVDNYRDHFEAEMYQIVAKEPKICEYILEYLRLQRKFFRDASVFLDTELEEVERQMQQGFRVPVFAETKLESHLAATNRTIASPIELCACGLISSGLKEEGLFRIAGGAAKVKKLKAAFDAGRVDLDYLKQEVCDPHVMANVLKCYLRELPEPLLTSDLHDEWINAIQIRDPVEKIQEIRRVLQKLPNSHYKNLEYLIHFLAYVTTYQEWNKMSPANVAIVIGPNILWPMDESGDGGHLNNMTTTRLCSMLVEQFVTNVHELFPVAGDYEFFVTCERQSDANSDTSQGVPNGDEFSSRRSHSVSSLEETSPPLDSPKPHLRRKKAPEPPNPTTFGTSSTTPIRHGKILDFPPPSPNQAASKKHTESQGNEEGTPSRTAPPPKPPQPNFMQAMGTRDTDTKSALMEKFSAQNSNPLKHNSSFNGSSAAVRQEMSQSQVNEQVTQNPATSFNSLPRHHHKEHSYNHKRTSSTSRARPPAFTGTVPVPRPAGQAMNMSGSTELLYMDDTRISSEASANNTKTVAKMDSKDDVKSEHQPDIQGSLKSQPTDPAELKNTTSVIPGSASIAEVPSSPSTAPSGGDSSRPVPAPRSSLVTGSQSFKDKDAGMNPVVKERPVIMAKPRDLSRRSMIVPSSDPLPASEMKKYRNSSQERRLESSIDSSLVGEHIHETTKNGLPEDAEPPKSPKANPSRPPRPHPPAPPKTKVDSTDL